MRSITRTTRSAFSLLEMVLALALAMVLMLALYLTLSTYLNSAHTGRDVMAEGEIPRSIMAKLSHDITNQVGALDTRCLPDYSAASNSSSSTSGTTDPTMAAPTVVPNSTPTDLVAFNIGVQGNDKVLRLAVYRVENPPVGNIANPNQGEITSDLRRIDYWLVTVGDKTLGLARREIKLATSNDIDIEPSDVGEQEKYIIAREVTGVTFQYHDGMTWQDSWDGWQPKATDGSDGTPTGPPAAIKMTMKIQRPANKLLTMNPNETAGPELTYTFVVAVPTGNNFTPKTAGP